MSNDNNRNDERHKKIIKNNKKMGYVILYLVILIIIIVGEIILYYVNKEISFFDLMTSMLGNLMGVLAAFLVFDIFHEKISKDSYASEVSKQILDTLTYHPETIELYDNEQKKLFVNTFISSIVDDSDMSEMINSYLNTYLLTKEDFEDKNNVLTEKDCRIRNSFSYRFVLENERTKAFSHLRTDSTNDPYFYVQEELNYSVKYLAPKGNNTDGGQVKLGLIYDNDSLDRFLRGNKSEQSNEIISNCIFRENLDIEEEDKAYFRELMSDKEKLIEVAKIMFRPHITIDRCRGELVDVEVGAYQGKDYGLIFTFDVEHTSAMEHDIDIIFHMPKKWNGILEVALVEPTKDPKISLSYNEDMMNVEMFSFLDKGESSSHENTLEDENGVYSISLSDEWVFPISGVVFVIKKAIE